MARKKDEFTAAWITENALDIIPKYEDGLLTIRGMHYLLVARGMHNTDNHYRRVKDAMVAARWAGLIRFEVFSDHERKMIGETQFQETDLENEIDHAKESISLWMRSYYKNRWENQENYVEVFIEKKTLQGIFSKPCKELRVALGACKGYPSLTFLNEAADRFAEAEAEGKKPVIVYFGDYDPSGQDIPRSLQANLSRIGVDVELEIISLTEAQVIEWGLPPAPTKKTDSRSANWDGLGQVELDAVEPNKLMQLCRDAVNSYFDDESYEELKEQEEEERIEYRAQLKNFVNNELKD